MAGDTYISKNHKLVIVWSPKCACSAVVDWFYHIEHLHAKKNTRRKWLIENGYHYPYQQAREFCENYGYKTIYFTRDPYERAVSAFLNKFYVYQGKPLMGMEDLEAFSRDFIHSLNARSRKHKTRDFFQNPFHTIKQAFTKRNATNAYQGISFVQYLFHVKYLMECNTIIDHHWDTQLPRNISFRIKPDYIVKQENFATDLDKINTTFNLGNYIPPKTNKTSIPNHFTETDFDYSQSNSISLIKEKKMITKNNLLRSFTRQLISEVYKEDFSFFSYQK